MHCFIDPNFKPIMHAAGVKTLDPHGLRKGELKVTEEELAALLETVRAKLQAAAESDIKVHVCALITAVACPTRP